MSTHTVSPPTSGTVSACSMAPRGGRSWYVRSLCHTSARAPSSESRARISGCPSTAGSTGWAGVGSPNSSNSNRLRELAQKQGVDAYLIDGAQDIRREWLDGRDRIGVTAGASAPESLVQGVVARLREWGAGNVNSLAGDPENMTFALPKELRVVVTG